MCISKFTSKPHINMQPQINIPNIAYVGMKDKNCSTIVMIKVTLFEPAFNRNMILAS